MSSRLFSNYGPILALLFLGLIVGLVLGGDYGVSTDERLHVTYARQTLETYAGQRDPSETISNLRFYGPFYSVLVETIKGAFERLRPDWRTADARHLTYFLSFLFAIFCLFLLCLRFVGHRAALFAALLFATQPLLFGHAFINPKDAPFMSFFLASVALGFLTVDAFGQRWGANARRQVMDLINLRAFLVQISEDWRNSHRLDKIALLVLLSLPLLFILDTLIFQLLLNSMHNALELAYKGEAWEPLSAAFYRLAEDAKEAPLNLYLSRLDKLYAWLTIPFLGLVSLPALLHSRKIFTWRTARGWADPYGTWGLLLLAGLILGLSTSIRVVGPFAGVLVSLLFIHRGGRRAILPLIFFWGIAALATLATWPFLWDSPGGRVAESLQAMAGFVHRSRELYRGELIRAFDLPWHYLPTLMVTQFTEAVYLLALIGFLSVLPRPWKKWRGQLDLILIGLWLILPIGTQVILRLTLYDNFRQYLFITPPLFIFGAVGFEWIQARIRSRSFRVALAALLLLPGLLGIALLHPYEYIYYNSFVGGVSGAHKRFELDYWCTSYREAMAYVNSVAPPNASVAVWQYEFLAAPFAREDLSVHSVYSEEHYLKAGGDYLLLCSPRGLKAPILRNVEPEWILEKQGAHLVIVKHPASGENVERGE